MGVKLCLQVYMVELVMILAQCLLRLKKKKKRECRDEMQEQGAKWQVQWDQLSMGSRSAEHSIRAHNLLEYMDR